MPEKEYIERNAIIKKLREDEECDCELIVLLYDYPAADVAPVKHGHWIYKNRTKLISTGVARTAEEGGAYVVKKHITVKVPYCSICGERGDNALDATPFCPDCGARMDGDADANGNDDKTPKT